MLSKAHLTLHSRMSGFSWVIIPLWLSGSWRSFPRGSAGNLPRLGIKPLSSTLAHAKLLQSCLTLCDPTDCSPPGSSVHGIFQARVLEWGAIAFSNSSWVISNPKRWCCESAALHMPASFENSSGHSTGKGQFSFQCQRGQCQRLFKLLHNCTHFTC